MKRFFVAALLSASFASHAAGQYDGVYQSTINKEQFYSIHQNGDTLMLAAYGTLPTDGSIALTYGQSSFRPDKMYTWDVQLGQIHGSSAIMTGGTMQNACTVTYKLDLAADSITATLIQAEPRLANIPCAALLPAGTTIKAIRMF